MILEKVQALNTEMLQFFQQIEDKPVLSVHGIRKRSKFMRALLKFDRDQAVQSIVILRNISRILSPYRDSQVMLETYRMFSQAPGNRPDSLVEELLSANPFLEDPMPDMIEMNTLTDLTDQLKIELENLKLDANEDQFEQFIAENIKTAKGLYMKIQSSTDPESVHDWRKKVKQVWYLLRLKYGEGIAEPSHITNQYDKLGKLLGDVHDLDILGEFILTHFKKFPIDLIQDYRSKILDNASTMSEHIFTQE